MQKVRKKERYPFNPRSLPPLPPPFLFPRTQDIPNPWRSSRSETSESIKVSRSPREPRPLFSIAQPPSHPLPPSPLPRPSLSTRLGSLAESQSLKKFFFGARPPESNINQITPSSRIPSTFLYDVLFSFAPTVSPLPPRYFPLDFALAVSSGTSTSPGGHGAPYRSMYLFSFASSPVQRMGSKSTTMGQKGRGFKR